MSDRTPSAAPPHAFGLVVSPMPKLSDGSLLYAEVVPAGSCWLPLPGRTSRWWFEVHSQDSEGQGVTYAYSEGGSGGGFTLRSCVARAMEAVDRFVFEEDE